jgi:two-component system, LytTR family, sensor kinase
MKVAGIGAISLVICGVLAGRDAAAMRMMSRIDPAFGLTRFEDELAWLVFFYLMWAALTPLILFLARRFPFRRSAWLGPLACHLAASLAMAAVAPVVLAILFGALWLGREWPSSPGSLLTPFWLRLAVYRAVSDVSFYWIVLGGGVGIDLYDAFQAQRLQAAALERSLAAAQFQALKMKLQPHFLFNTLNSIAFLALERDAPAIVTMVDRLGRLLRASVQTSSSQMVTLAEELSLLDQYLAIEEVRFKDRLRVIRRVDPVAASALVPSLVLQPIVENSIKHGFSRRIDASRIELTISLEADGLVVVVQDDGPGLPPGWALATHCGRGLKNIVERLDTLYRDRWSFSLQNGPAGGALAELRIPRGGTQPADAPRPSS